ncbi:MAG: acyl-CoA thioesterase [Chlorobi bacterium]|nr:acyl-CoA thioesterase [Chlorobiota bacterium]
MKEKYIFQLEMQVRDYECDIQGIVNNSVYQNYLEHTRHEFIKTAGLDFAKLHEEGIDPVVYRVEIDYKLPLKSGDKFISKLNYETNGHVKINFLQDIYRKKDDKLIVRAKVIAVILKNGKPIKSNLFINAFDTLTHKNI